MKRLPLITFLTVGIILSSLFLPYRVVDFYDGVWYDIGNKISSEFHSGLEIDDFFIVFAVFIVALVSLIKRNILTAVLAFILQSVYLLYILVFFALTISDYYTSEVFETRIGIGLYFLAFASLFYFIVLLVNLVKEVKKKKNHPDSRMDILDDI